MRTARLALMPLRADHAEALFRATADARTYRYLPTDPPRNVETLRARYERIARGPVAVGEQWWNWAVALLESPAEPFGTVELSLSEGGTHAVLGYVFGWNRWGRGYAFEACGGVLAHLRARTAVRHVEALVDTRNARSIALATRLGMLCAETIPSADHFKGSSSDEYRFTLALARTGDHDGQARDG